MCRTTKLKFACKHTSLARLSSCLGHYTKASVVFSGKVKSWCKGKEMLKLKIPQVCPLCGEREKARRMNEAVRDRVLAVIEENLQRLDEDSQGEFIKYRNDTKAGFDISMSYLDAKFRAARHRVKAKSVGPEIRQEDNMTEAAYQRAGQERNQRKLDVIAQWNKRNAPVVQRDPGACKVPVDGKLPSEVARPKLVLFLTQRKKQVETLEMRKSEETRAEEPLST